MITFNKYCAFQKKNKWTNLMFQYTLLYTLWVFTIETWRVSIADSYTFHLNLMRHNVTNHWPRASFPLIHGSRGLLCHLNLLKDIVCKLRYIVPNVLWRNDQTISITIKYSHSSIILDRRQSKMLWTIAECVSQIARNSVLDCHLSPVGRQTAIKNFVSNNLRSTFVDSINVFECHLFEVFIEFRDWIRS